MKEDARGSEKVIQKARMPRRNVKEAKMDFIILLCSINSSHIEIPISPDDKV